MRTAACSSRWASSAGTASSSRCGGARRALGTVRGCVEPRKHPRGTFLVGFVAALATIWTASAFIARRLTRPLGELVRVTRAIGNGDLAARVRLGRHQTGEVGALADSVNEMAVRIETMLREERELMAAVSHELRSPLARLRVLVELARSGASEPRLLEIEREIVGIDALIGKLLALRRGSSSALHARKRSSRTKRRRALSKPPGSRPSCSSTRRTARPSKPTRRCSRAPSGICSRTPPFTRAAPNG